MTKIKLHVAARHNSTLVAEYLINELNVNKEALDLKYRTSLFLAALFSTRIEYIF
jgi:hypothetical protein